MHKKVMSKDCLTIYTWGNRRRIQCPYPTSQSFNACKIQGKIVDHDLSSVDGRQTTLQREYMGWVTFRQELASIVDYVQEHPEWNSIDIFCPGGRHRSVALAEQVAIWLRGQGIHVYLKHVELESQYKTTKRKRQRQRQQARKQKITNQMDFSIPVEVND